MTTSEAYGAVLVALERARDCRLSHGEDEAGALDALEVLRASAEDARRQCVEAVRRKCRSLNGRATELRKAGRYELADYRESQADLCSHLANEIEAMNTEPKPVIGDDSPLRRKTYTPCPECGGGARISPCVCAKETR